MPSGSAAVRNKSMSSRMEALDLQILSKSELLSQLEPPEVKEILSLASIERYATNDVIFNKGDPGDRFYAILDGQVGINTVSQDGKEIFLNILNQGEVFGEIAVLDGKERTAGAVAMQSTELLRIGRTEFLPFLERHPRLCIRLMAVLCQRLRWTSAIIEDTIFLDIPRRLAKRLLTLVERHGEAIDGGIRLQIKLSQEDLGHMLGATRESVNKGVRSLQQLGAISYIEGHIVIDNMRLLEELVGEDELDGADG